MEAFVHVSLRVSDHVSVGVSMHVSMHSACVVCVPVPVNADICT